MTNPTEETITKALDNLEIDADPINSGSAVLEETVPKTAAAVADHSQAYLSGYPQMHHPMMGLPPMPPHMMNYPSHSQYVMMDGNVNDVSGANVGLPPADFNSFNPYSMIHPAAGINGGANSENFWSSANPRSVAASGAPDATTGAVNFMNEASFAAAPSSALDDTATGDDSIFENSLNQPKSRRQTFHSGSNGEASQHLQHASGVPAGVASSRTQSISIEGSAGNIFAGADATAFAKEGKADAEAVPQGFHNTSFSPTYPYNGPLMQPNAIYNGHPMSGSPFQPFAFQGFHSFSPLPSTAHTGDNGDAGASGLGVPGDEFGDMPPHSDSPANMAWMYGSHSPYPMGHNSMMMPNNGGMKHGGLYGNANVKNNRNKNSKKNNFHNGNAGYMNQSGGSRGNNYYPRNKNDMGFNNNNNNNNNAEGAYNGKNFKNENYRAASAASAKFANAELSDFIGSIYSLCKDQHGCRFLQKQLDTMGFNAAELIFFEIKEHIVELMVDSFGNYLVQKLLEVSSEEQKLELITIAAPDFVKISLDSHGTRALQKLVECISSLKEVEIIQKALETHVVELSKDLNGNHVVQKLLTKLKFEDSQFIFDECCAATMVIATQRHGCCVLQRCLDYGSLEQRSQLCDTIMENLDVLSIDPYGNYVVQYILTKEAEYGEVTYTDKVVETLKEQVVKLSLHKFGSNVVENILRSPRVSHKIVEELVKSGEDNISKLLNDSYGNYVLQTSLDSVKDTDKKDLFNKLSAIVKPMLTGPIRATPHGRRMISIIEGSTSTHHGNNNNNNNNNYRGGNNNARSSNGRESHAPRVAP